MRGKITRLAVLLPVFLLVVACAKPWPERQPIEVSPVSVSDAEWRVTDEVVVITDASGTMVDEATFPEARALTQSFVAAMPDANVRAKSTEPYRAGLVSFGGPERKGAPLAEFDRWVLNNEAARLRPLGAAGNRQTPLHEVLGEVKSELAGGAGRAAIVVFSDGLPDSEATTLAAAQSLISSRPGEVCIHTVHSGEDAAGRDFLARLSQLTSCGSARAGDSLGDASAIDGFERDVFLAAAPRAMPPVAARPDPCSRKIVLRGIQFPFDKAEIQPESTPVLDVAAEQLKQCPAIQVGVDGHTCSIGTDEYNQGLSERRAAAVRSYLVGAGVSADRLQAQGHGEASPVASNDTRDGRAQNRRVELSPR
jgi:OOP family OmpA-OmpF porin